MLESRTAARVQLGVLLDDGFFAGQTDMVAVGCPALQFLYRDEGR